MDEQRLEEMYRLVRENNKMLHAQRRGAFIGGILRVVIWIAFIALPLWLYVTYLAPVMQTALQAAQQLQTAGGQAQNQFGDMQNTLKSLQEQVQKVIQKQ